MMHQLTAKSGNLCWNRLTMCRNDARSGSYLKYKQRVRSPVRHGNRIEATSPFPSLIHLRGSKWSNTEHCSLSFHRSRFFFFNE